MKVFTMLAVAAGASLISSFALAGGKMLDRDHEYRFRRAGGDAIMVVPPDTLTISVGIVRVGADLPATLAALQGSAQDLGQRAQKAFGAQARLQLLHFSVSPTGEKKTETSRNLSASGAIEVPLAAELDYWGRAELLVKAAALAREVEEESKDPKKGVSINLGSPTPLVRNTDGLRAELIRRWVEDARAFAAAAQSAGAPLHLLRCDPPGSVEQRPLGIGGVGLWLRQNCAIDVGK